MRCMFAAIFGALVLAGGAHAISFPDIGLPRGIYIDFRIPSTIYVDAAYLTYARHFPTETNALTDTQEGLDGGVHTLRAQSFLPPLPLSPRTMLVSGLSFETTAFHYEPARPGLVERVYAVNLVAGLMYAYDSHWSLGGLVMPTVESDLLGFGGDDVSYLAGLGAQYSFSPAVSVVGGLVYASYLDLPVPVPGFAVFAQGRTVKVSAIVPLMAEAWYIPHQRIEVGLVWDWSSRMFHLNQRYEAQGRTYDDGYVSYSQGTLALGTNLRVWRQLWTTAHAGLSLFNWWEWLDDVSQKTYDTTMKDHRFVRLGLIYRFQLSEGGPL